MALNLAVLAGKRSRADVPFMDQSVRVIYNPILITAAWIAESNKSDDEFIEKVSEVLISWDIKQGSKNVPINAETLKTIPFALLRAIYNAMVGGAAEEAEAEGKDSNAG